MFGICFLGAIGIIMCSIGIIQVYDEWGLLGIVAGALWCSVCALVSYRSASCE